MIFLPAAILGLIYAYTTTAVELTSSTSISLPSDISDFIPLCAQPCFSLFVGANFPTSDCTTSPTLSCLCTHNTTSGFTAGEGALQCIAGAKLAGVCTGSDGTTEAGLKGYNMCAGENEALPNTHPTITATSVVFATAPTLVTTTATSYIVTASTFSTTTRSSTSGSRSSSSSSTSTTTFIPTSILTAPGTGSTSTTSSSVSNLASSATAPPTAAPNSESAPSHLTGQQVTGIAVGSVGGVLAVIALVLFCCFRRRRQAEKARDSDSFLLPFQLEPGNETTISAGFKGPTETWTGAKTAPPIPERVETIRAVPPSMTSRLNAPGVIGVAISPDSRFKPDRGHDYDRRQSVLLPPKPTLEPFVNPRGSPPRTDRPDKGQSQELAKGAVPTMGNLQRASTATEFDEDPQDYRESGMSVPSPALISAPSRGLGRGRENLPPMNTNFIAPLKVNRPTRASSRSNQNYSRQMSMQPLPTASSNYSNGTYMRESTQSRQPGSGYGYYNRGQPPPPQPQFRPYRPPPPPQTQVNQKQRRDSGGSMTSIESAEDQSQPLTPDNRQSTLSPVVESPRVGRDLYPPIPGSAASPTTHIRSPGMPKPLFTATTDQRQKPNDNMPPDLAVYDAFWRPKPTTSQPSPSRSQVPRLSNQQPHPPITDFERQKRLRMSQATNTSQAQSGRNQGARTGRLPLLPALQIPLPSQTPSLSNFPSAAPKSSPRTTDPRRQSVMDRGRPNIDYTARGSTVSAGTADSSTNSLMDRRGKRAIIAPIRTVRSDGKTGSAGGDYEEVLSPTGRSVTPRRIGNDLYLDMS